MEHRHVHGADGRTDFFCEPAFQAAGFPGRGEEDFDGVLLKQRQEQQREQGKGGG